MARKEDGNTAVAAMDSEKNLPLPFTGVRQEYSKRQMWVDNLCIHDTLTDDAMMYVYAEDYDAEDPNEVIRGGSPYIHPVTTYPEADTIYGQLLLSE